MWKLCGSYVEAVWKLCGSCVEACGSCVEAMWKLCGSCTEAVWKLCGQNRSGSQMYQIIVETELGELLVCNKYKKWTCFFFWKVYVYNNTTPS